MMPSQFDFASPATINEALNALRKRNAVALAGGIGLFKALRTKNIEPDMVVDLSKIAGLAGVTVDNSRGIVSIGAMTTFAELAQNREAAKNCPLLCEVAGKLADPQVRNRATVGGSLVQNDPGSDFPVLALTLNAQVNIVGKSGSRTVSADDFFGGGHQTALKKAELIVSVDFRICTASSGSAYEKFANPADGSAVCSAAVSVEKKTGGHIGTCRIALTGTAASVVRLPAMEAGLEGVLPTAEAIASAWQKGRKGLRFRSDLAASSEYRAHLAGVLLKRALIAAAGS